jgi:hypothetical protein
MASKLRYFLLGKGSTKLSRGKQLARGGKDAAASSSRPPHAYHTSKKVRTCSRQTPTSICARQAIAVQELMIYHIPSAEGVIIFFATDILILPRIDTALRKIVSVRERRRVSFRIHSRLIGTLSRTFFRPWWLPMSIDVSARCFPIDDIDDTFALPYVDFPLTVNRNDGNIRGRPCTATTFAITKRFYKCTLTGIRSDSTCSS